MFQPDDNTQLTYQLDQQWNELYPKILATFKGISQQDIANCHDVNDLVSVITRETPDGAEQTVQHSLKELVTAGAPAPGFQAGPVQGTFGERHLSRS